MQLPELEAAGRKADLALEAARQLEQAGRGLFLAFTKCKANTADGQTLADLLVITSYVNEAARLLVEREGFGVPKAIAVSETARGS